MKRSSIYLSLFLHFGLAITAQSEALATSRGLECVIGSKTIRDEFDSMGTAEIETNIQDFHIAATIVGGTLQISFVDNNLNLANEMTYGDFSVGKTMGFMISGGSPYRAFMGRCRHFER